MAMMRHPQTFRAASRFAGVLGMALAGCGGSTGDVSGIVRFKAAPMPGGQVTFTSRDKSGVSVYAWIGEDGNYRIHGCPTGPVKITVLPLERSRSGKGPKGLGVAGKSEPRRKLPVIPLRYTDPNTTDLEYSVVAGPQQFQIELKP